MPDNVVESTAFLSKFFLSMALAAIGLNTVTGVGIKPMIAGVIIDSSVVFVSLFAQDKILQFIN